MILSFRFGFSMSNLYIETPGEVSEEYTEGLQRGSVLLRSPGYF